LFTVDSLYELRVRGSVLLVASLAHLHRYDLDRRSPPEPVDGVFWDAAAFDGDVAYYFYQTISLERRGGRMFAWRLGTRPRELAILGQPQAIALGARHVYWLDDASHEVRRTPRLDGF